MNDRKVLHSWKEVAAHVGRSVRTVQRWEREHGLPVHRPAGKDRSAVLAFTDEIDRWLEQTPSTERPYVRPVILVVDPPQPNAISDRKLELEIHKFNVLTAFSSAEVLATAKVYDVHGFVLNAAVETAPAGELLSELKELYPHKPVVVVTGEVVPQFQEQATVMVKPSAQELTRQLVALFGEPRLL